MSWFRAAVKSDRQKAAHRRAVGRQVAPGGRRGRASSVCGRAPTCSVACPLVHARPAVCAPTLSPRSPFPPTATARLLRVRGLVDTQRRRAQRHSNGRLAAPLLPPCTFMGPSDHGTAHGRPSSPLLPSQPCSPPHHCSRPRPSRSAGPCDQGPMSGRPTHPPRAMQPRLRRLPVSCPPSLGRRDSRPLLDGGRPALKYHRLGAPRLGRRQRDTDRADPENRLARLWLDDRRHVHLPSPGARRFAGPHGGRDSPRLTCPFRGPAGPAHGPPGWSAHRRPTVRTQGPRRSSPGRRPAGLLKGPRRWSPARGPAGAPQVRSGWRSPRRPAGHPSASPRWSPPQRPADDPRCAYGAPPPLRRTYVCASPTKHVRPRLAADNVPGVCTSNALERRVTHQAEEQERLPVGAEGRSIAQYILAIYRVSQAAAAVSAADAGGGGAASTVRRYRQPSPAPAAEDAGGGAPTAVRDWREPSPAPAADAA